MNLRQVSRHEVVQRFGPLQGFDRSKTDQDPKAYTVWEIKKKQGTKKGQLKRRENDAVGARGRHTSQR